MPMELVTQLPYDHPYRWDGTLFGGPKLWRPTELATALWLDAEDTSTITLNGATVSQWADKSGNGRNAAQATATNQPTYTATAINGKPGIKFDGTNDIMLLPDGTIPAGDSSYSMFVAIKWDATSPQFVVGAGTSAGVGTANYLAAISTTPAVMGSWWVSYGGSCGVIALGPEFYGAVYDNSVSTLYGNKNGGSITNTVQTVDRNSATTNHTIGAFATGSSPLNASIGEIVITQSALSTAVRQRVEGYLAWKWGLEANLPAGHPYKSLPPTV
jgi:hypothetical protein